MKQVVSDNKTGEITVRHVPPPAVKAGHVLVRTLYSVISAGTERTSIETRRSSLLERAKKNPDVVAKVFEQVKQYGLLATYKRVRARLESGVGMGYSASGVVIAVGNDVEEFKPGDTVACAGAGYANHAEFNLIPKNLCAKVPKGVDPADAAYTTIGSIALQGIRQLEPTLGETIVVIGLGLLGQITVQMLKSNGCNVVGIDLDKAAVELAKKSGADVAVSRTEDVKKIVLGFTHGAGADGVIITAATKSDDPVQLAGDLCREGGRVVLVGDVGLKLPRGPYYMKELDFRFSRSYGPGRYDVNYEGHGHDYPIGRVRWTENRNMQEFLRLVADRKVDAKLLTTHQFPIDEAKEAYAVIAGTAKRRERYVGVLLKYAEPSELSRQTKIALKAIPESPVNDPLNIGFLGAGSFAQSSLLPPIRRFKDSQLVGVCTGNGLNAANVGKTFGFGFATTSAEEIIQSKEIGTVFIAARHNLHAPYTIEALKAGKHVFVEKPLAMNDDELNKIVGAYSRRHTKSVLMVGFNRRFSPHLVQAKEFFGSAVSPFVLTYRVNAGMLPASHWTKDPREGGGRIVGEVCHFIDVLQFMSKAVPVRVFADRIEQTPTTSADDDSVIITVKLSDGSIGTIVYQANGESSWPKEYIEISSTNRTAVVDNFQTLTLFTKGEKTEHKRATIDKGHFAEVHAFLRAVSEGGESPIPFESLVATTRATFRILDSMKLGVPINL